MSVTAPQGFTAAGLHAGIKADDKDKKRDGRGKGK